MATIPTSRDLVAASGRALLTRHNMMNAGRGCAIFCGLLNITLLVVGILGACHVINMSGSGIATCILFGISPLISPLLTACGLTKFFYSYLFDS